VVERQLPKLNVVGSIPIARSSFAQLFLQLGSLHLIEIRWRDLIEVIDAAALRGPLPRTSSVRLRDMATKQTTNTDRTAAT
jgi:hypothetical protein